jgi:K+-transporting ATPase KdpF subunit
MNWESQILTMIVEVVPNHSNTAIANGAFSYITGSVIALLILGYLIYSLLRPEKF